MVKASEHSKHREYGPVAVVTGANRGIGKGVVRTLCRRYEGYIYLTSRNKTLGEAALKEIKDEAPCKRPEKLRYHQLDITSRESIVKLHDDILDLHGGLDILVNNAAIAYPITSTEPFGEQANKTINTNFMSLVMVCHILFPILRPYARVVNVGSSAGLLDNLQKSTAGEELKRRLMDPSMTEEQLVNLMKEFVTYAQNGTHVEKGWPDSAYSASKIGVSKLTFIQYEALSKSPKADLIVNVIHPGPVKTDMNPRGQLTLDEGSLLAVWGAMLKHNWTEFRGEFVWNDCSVANWATQPVLEEPEVDVQFYSARPVIYASLLPHNMTSPRGKLLWYDRFIIPWNSQTPPTNPSLDARQQIYWKKTLRNKNSTEFYDIPDHINFKTNLAGYKQDFR